MTMGTTTTPAGDGEPPVDLKPFPRSGRPVERIDGFLPLEAYAAPGEGRSVALSGADGSIDWWCCPDIDSPALLDRLTEMIDPDTGAFLGNLPQALPQALSHLALIQAAATLSGMEL